MVYAKLKEEYLQISDSLKAKLVFRDSKLFDWAKDIYEHDLKYAETFSYHIVPSIKFSLYLADILKADKRVCAYAALLHDIGYSEGTKFDHDEIGAQMAKNKLFDLDYEFGFVEAVSHSILSHRGEERKPGSLEGEIVMNADGMAHLDCFPFIAMVYIRNGLSSEAVLAKLQAKLKKTWRIKLSLTPAKKLMKDKYVFCKNFVDDFQDYLD